MEHWCYSIYEMSNDDVFVRERRPAAYGTDTM